MEISAKMIAELRAKTSLPIMECKAALIEAKGDEAVAIEILRKKGLAKREKKSEREVKNGYIDGYLHDGKIGVIVEVLTETDFVARNEEFRAFVHNLCLQVANSRPKYVSKDQVPTEEIEEEKKLYLEQVRAEGKPEEIAKKIVEGKIEKYYEEVCLLNQPFVKDQTKKVDELLSEMISKIGENIVISRFCRFELGS